MSKISGGPYAVSGIGWALPNPIHWPTRGMIKLPFRAGNLYTPLPPQMNLSRSIKMTQIDGGDVIVI